MYIHELCVHRRIIPVVVMDRVEDASPLAEALLAGGITSMEITLRTAVGLDAIAAVAQMVPDMIVGAGTVLTVQQMQDAANAGAQFQVSPGFTSSLADYAHQQQIAWLPGIATSSELMRVREAGIDHVKFFPAESLGGAAMLKQLTAVFRDIRFCPTGGVSLATMSSYLAIPSVCAIGGSWLAPAPLIAAGEWMQITRIATDSVSLITN